MEADRVRPCESFIIYLFIFIYLFIKLFAGSLSGSLRWKAVRSVSIEKRYLCVAIRQGRLEERLPLAISHKFTPKINLTITDAQNSLITQMFIVYRRVYLMMPSHILCT